MILDRQGLWNYSFCRAVKHSLLVLSIAGPTSCQQRSKRIQPQGTKRYALSATNFKGVSAQCNGRSVVAITTLLRQHGNRSQIPRRCRTQSNHTDPPHHRRAELNRPSLSSRNRIDVRQHE